METYTEDECCHREQDVKKSVLVSLDPDATLHGTKSELLGLGAELKLSRNALQTVRLSIYDSC